MSAESPVAGLLLADAYPHPVSGVTLLETHISWIFLAGDFAYKVKKPVDLGFLDFTTLERRRICCEAELRLNRRLAPGLYLDVVPVSDTGHGLRVGGGGIVIDYAVKMLRFDQEDLASRLAARGALSGDLLDRFAERLARFHEEAAVAGAGTPHGATAAVHAAAEENFAQLDAAVREDHLRRELEDLRSWTVAAGAKLAPVMAARCAAGRIRECHGDLHLGNIVLRGGELVAFDCIEFSEGLRWIDVMSDVAFLAMDLCDRGRADLASRFLSGYLEACGDYDGVRVLRYYLVYRALVRAKVHAMRAMQAGRSAVEASRLAAQCRHYVALASAFARGARAILVLMHGLSGSGKTGVSRQLLETLGAIRLRSDVERKRMHGVASRRGGEFSLKSDIYDDDSTRRTYERLVEAGRHVLEAGYPLILDAASLQRWQRNIARDLAVRCGVPFVIASCEAPEAVLRERVAARRHAADDASDAGDAVVTHQIECRDSLAPDELSSAVIIETNGARAVASLQAACAQIAKHRG